MGAEDPLFKVRVMAGCPSSGCDWGASGGCRVLGEHAGCSMLAASCPAALTCLHVVALHSLSNPSPAHVLHSQTPACPAAVHLWLHRQAQGRAAHHRRLHGERRQPIILGFLNQSAGLLLMPHACPSCCNALTGQRLHVAGCFQLQVAVATRPLALNTPCPFCCLPSTRRSTPPPPSSTCLPSSPEMCTGALPTAAGSLVSMGLCGGKPTK